MSPNPTALSRVQGLEPAQWSLALRVEGEGCSVPCKFEVRHLLAHDDG